MTTKKKALDFSRITIENGHIPAPKAHSEDVQRAFEILDKMSVGQSIKFGTQFLKSFLGAKTSLRRNHNRTFIYRNIDKHNVRLWRLEDGKVLKTVRKKKK